MLINRIRDFDHQIASILSQLAYHIDPIIIRLIQENNQRERQIFEALFKDKIPVNDYLYEGSDCVFPGVKRYVSRAGMKRKYNPEFRAIIDDNEFPRHIWCYLQTGKAYSGPNWKASGLYEFELAHVFSHKDSELCFETSLFNKIHDSLVPSGDFTSAANVVLLPKGTIRPTDNSPIIKAVFYKRYIDLYGTSSLRGREGFKENVVPNWYSDLKWNSPWRPMGWEKKIANLIEYRTTRIRAILKNA